MLEATRATLTRARPIPRLGRLILAVFARRRLLAVVLAGARMLRATGLARLLARLPGRIGFAMAMLSATAPAVRVRPYTARGAGGRGRVAILAGCVMRGLYARINRATARTLIANEYQLVDAPGQQCCGALHAHAGDLEGARRLARANIAAFEQAGAEVIATNAAGCGAMMKEYGHILAGDPAWERRAAVLAARVRDVSELLAAAGPKRAAALHHRVTYDAPCHLLHAQRIMREPLAILAAVPQLDIVPLTDADQCCGAAGIYNLLEPETSDAVLRPKLGHIAATGADLVVTGNPGCQMQIGAGLLRAGSRTRTVHPVELLDAAYAAE